MTQARSAGATLGVAIIEDSAMLSELIEEAVSEHPHLHVSGSVRTAREAHTEIPWSQTDVASIDLHLPDGLGSSLGKRIRVSYPDVRVLILSDHRRPSLLEALQPEEIPYWSYALKASIEGRAQLSEIIHTAAMHPYIDPAIYTVSSAAESNLAALGEQQRKILALVAKGHTNAVIAERLGVTNKAIEYHLKQIYAALELAPASEANQRVLAAVAYLQMHAPDRHV